MRTQYRQMTEKLAAVTGTATSPDGVVTVVAGPDGSVKEVTFSEQVRKADPAALSASVVHTIAQARVNATREQAEIMRRNLDDTHLLDQVLAEDARLFGTSGRGPRSSATGGGPDRRHSGRSTPYAACPSGVQRRRQFRGLPGPPSIVTCPGADARAKRGV